MERPSEEESLRLFMAFYSIREANKRAEVVALAEEYASPPTYVSRANEPSKLDP